jgi:hypothetical protein
MTEEAFIPIEKVAQHFCVGVHTIRSWVRQGHIPRSSYIKVGNTYRFSLPRVTDALTGGNMKDPEPETADMVGEVPAEVNEGPIQLELDFDADKDI